MTTLDRFFLEISPFLEEHQHITTVEAVNITGMNRSVVNLYLNQLVTKETLKKTNTRPVRFSLMVKENPFNKVIGVTESLKQQVIQSRASVTYPPNGLPLLIYGNSGVGKSFFAKIIYEYAIYEKVIFQEAPFVVLNCSDYANNKELLSSVLFGYEKGAFSGASEAKIGLVEEANGGYLFLDEVHNLSPENQEKLFLLLDESKFRPVGANAKWRHSDVRLIMATTENPDSTLLTTFKRRIPMFIKLPDFSERLYNEREEIVMNAFINEQDLMGTKILLGEGLYHRLINQAYDGNIGEILNDIKVACATQFSQSIVGETIEIGEAPFISVKKAVSDTTELLTYDFQVLNGMSYERVFAYLDKRIEALFLELFINHDPKNSHGLLSFYLENLKKLEGYLTSKGLELHQKKIQKIILALLLIRKNSETATIEIKSLAAFYYNSPKYSLLAKDIFGLMNQQENYSEKELELLALYLSGLIKLKSEIPGLIAMHGKGNASSLAQVVNQLVGDFVFESFDLSLDSSVEDVIAEINHYVGHINTTKGVALLVDMGSLEQMYLNIQKQVSGDLLVFNNVSTLLALDVGIKLSKQENIQTLETIKIENFSVSKKYYAGVSNSINIVVSCVSGEGIAKKIKAILEKYIDKNTVDIICLDYNVLQQMILRNDYSMFKDTVSIISTSYFDHATVPIINVEQIINGSSNLDLLTPHFDLPESKQKCTNDIIKLFTIEGASARLNFIDPNLAINEVEKVIDKYEAHYHMSVDHFLRINLFLHLSAMIERILTGDGIEEEVLEEDKDLLEFINVSKLFFEDIETVYHIEVPLSEIKLIYMILKVLL